MDKRIPEEMEGFFWDIALDIAAKTTVFPAPVGITNKGDFLPFVLKEYLRLSIALI